MILGWLLHAFYSTALAYLLSLAFGTLSLPIAVISVVFGAVFGFRHAKRFANSHPEFQWVQFSKTSAGTVEIVLFTFLLYVGIRHFVWLFYPQDHGWSTLTAFNFGDLPLHINYVRSLAGGISFPPHNPSFASQLLHYPFGPDLYNALFEVMGVRLQAHLAVVGILALCTSLICLRAFGGWWAIGGFFLNGGFAGWDIFSKGLSNSHQNVDWKNLLLSVFVTQRGMLFALPAGLFLLNCVQRHVSKERTLSSSQLTVLGLIWAILPLFHLHTFIAVSLMMVGYALVNGGWREAKALLTSRMALIAYLPATYQVLSSTEFFKKASVVKIQWGWMANETPFLTFAITNFGFWLLVPVLIAIAIYFRQRETGVVEKKLWFELALNLSLLFVFFNVMLAPWPWDNIKVLIWPYLGLTRLAWIVIDPYLERLAGAAAQGAMAAILFFSGFTVVLWSVQSPQTTGAQIYHLSQLANAEGALVDVPKTAIFAAATTHDHVLTYFGRMRVVGYEGHVWSHGIDGSLVIPKLKSLMRGEGDWISTAKELGVQYIYWGPQERALFGPEEKPWMGTLKNISRVPEHAIYLVPL